MRVILKMKKMILAVMYAIKEIAIKPETIFFRGFFCFHYICCHLIYSLYGVFELTTDRPNI